jgi:phage terminase large subunit-like protein
VTDILDRELAAFDRGAGVVAVEREILEPLDILERLSPKTVRTPALEIVNRAVVRAIRTPDARLIIVLPPQLGKSTTATRAGAMYALRSDPSWRIVIASYADRIAHRFGRMIRNDILANQGRYGGWDCGLRIAADQKAKHEWELTSGGGVYSVGVGGPLTSRSADLMIIDDPLKGRKDADSQSVRDDVWEWWQGTVASRLQPGTSVILILTRWHHEDLAGKLMADQPGEWELLHIPAQADPEIVDPDPLGRLPGEFLESAQGWTREQWEKRKREAGDEWVPLHQGNPQASGGDSFDSSKLRWWRWNRDRTGLICGQREWSLLHDCWIFISMDTATSTKTSADWTVASIWAIPIDGSLILLDVLRDRVPAHRQIDVARPLVERWGPAAIYVEPSMRSTQLAREAALAGWTFRDVIADTDKVRRAAPAARRVEHGEVWWPSGPDGIEADAPLLDYIRKEIEQFPAGRHDDFVDTFGYAARVAFHDYVPPPDSTPAGPPDGWDPLAAATDVMPGFDPETAAW